jgi:hypothetical protein
MCSSGFLEEEPWQEQAKLTRTDAARRLQGLPKRQGQAVDRMLFQRRMYMQGFRKDARTL